MTARMAFLSCTSAPAAGVPQMLPPRESCVLLKCPQCLHTHCGDGDITGEDIVRWLFSQFTSGEQIGTWRLRCRQFVKTLSRIVVNQSYTTEISTRSGSGTDGACAQDYKNTLLK